MARRAIIMGLLALASLVTVRTSKTADVPGFKAFEDPDKPGATIKHEAPAPDRETGHALSRQQCENMVVLDGQMCGDHLVKHHEIRCKIFKNTGQVAPRCTCQRTVLSKQCQRFACWRDETHSGRLPFVIHSPLFGGSMLEYEVIDGVCLRYWDLLRPIFWPGMGYSELRDFEKEKKTEPEADKESEVDTNVAKEEPFETEKKIDTETETEAEEGEVLKPATELRSEL